MWRCGVAASQETEDLALDEKLTHAGVDAVLRDPAKGSYFVTTVRKAVRASYWGTPGTGVHHWLCWSVHHRADTAIERVHTRPGFSAADWARCERHVVCTGGRSNRRAIDDYLRVERLAECAVLVRSEDKQCKMRLMVDTALEPNFEARLWCMPSASSSG